MAVLSDTNLKEFKKKLDDLEGRVKNWDKYLTDASNSLNKSVGKTFRAEYTMGKNATEKIQMVLELLKTLRGDLATLVVAAEVYYDQCVKASKKAASNSTTKTSSSKSSSTKSSSTAKKTTTTKKTTTRTTSTKKK